MFNNNDKLQQKKNYIYISVLMYFFFNCSIAVSLFYYYNKIYFVSLVHTGVH